MSGLRLLTFAPQFREADGVLILRTSVLARILTLGLYRREVKVDRKARYITIEHRLAWFHRRSRLIPFRHVHRIDYDYDSTATSVSRGWHGEAHIENEVETFTVSLVLRPREDVPSSHADLYEEKLELARFHGDGTGTSVRSAIDLHGSQESLSKAYVDRLSALLGVGFGMELPAMTDAGGQRWACTACGRNGPPRPGKCYYCGGALARS